MKYEKLLEQIEKVAPVSLAESWDNSGIQIRTRDEIEKILVCLEITKDVVAEAEEGGYDLIISHHPLLFDQMRSIDIYQHDAALSRQSDLAMRLIRSGIDVYSAHTSFDSAPEGNNVYVCGLLGAEDIEGPDERLAGSIGTLNGPVYFSEFCGKVEKALDLEKGYIRTVGDLETPVMKVAVCTGAGGIFIDDAISEGADVLVTGDVKFDQAQKAMHHGLCLIDAGHFGTEKIFAENFAAQLRKLCDGVIIDESRMCRDPYK